jgi:hypothetical protein
MIGLGIVSFGRLQYRSVALQSVRRWCPVDVLVTVVDTAPVATAKNQALRQMLDAGCDWLFLAEDDIEVTDERAVTGYVQACQASGYGHLMSHGHSSHNPCPRGQDASGKVTYWPNCVAPWSVYSRASLETCGLMDEAFFNAWEHVEHSQRLALAGFTSPFPDNADATGSERWLRCQPGALENTSIPQTPEWEERSRDTGLQYWRENRPETYRLIWPVPA